MDTQHGLATYVQPATARNKRESCNTLWDMENIFHSRQSPLTERGRSATPDLVGGSRVGVNSCRPRIRSGAGSPPCRGRYGGPPIAAAPYSPCCIMLTWRSTGLSSDACM